jgi:hypothetical protein
MKGESDPDEASAVELAETIGLLETQLQTERVKHDVFIRQQLTTEQEEKLRKMGRHLKDRMGDRPERPQMRGERGDRGPRGDKMRDKMRERRGNRDRGPQPIESEV